MSATAETRNGHLECTLYQFKYIFTIVASFLMSVYARNSSAQTNNSQNKNSKRVENKEPAVAIFTSSREGERLSRKIEKFTSGNKISEPVITVDSKFLYQRVEGFGATFNEAGMICLNALPVKERNNVFRSLFDTVQGAGFTLMKSPIAACDFASAGPWYSYNETMDDTLMKHFSIERDLAPNGLVTYIRHAKKFGKFEIESPMDFAPDWMYYSLDSGKKHIKPEYCAALARYYTKYLQSYAASGVEIKYLNLFNEADNSWYSNVTYHEIGQLIKNFVVPQLKASGLNTKIQFGESSNRPEAILKFPSGLDDVEVRKHIHSVTVHGYDWDKFSTLTELHDRYPRLPIWQTEVCYAKDDVVPPGGPSKLPVYGFEDGEFWGNMITNDMKNWVSAWVYWNMILDEHGGPWLISPEHGDPDKNYQHPVVIINRDTKKVSYTGLYYYLAHFSRFVRPGAYRIKCSGGSKDLNFIGFRNSDGTIILNIINNNNEASDCTIVWNNKRISQTLPAHAIVTFKWKGN